jgi:UDP-3-O-[3-hydroxymyristoyl] glucosamine N-acyltransferase
MENKHNLLFISKSIGANLQGSSDCVITGINSLEKAKSDELSFLSSLKHLKYLKETDAGAVIISSKFKEYCNTNMLIVDDPYLGYAKASKLFTRTPVAETFAHKTAIIADNSVIGNNVYIGANVVIDSNVTIKDNSYISSGCFIGANTIIGKNTNIKNSVQISDNIIIGNNCIIHHGAVIGGDGFGNAREGVKWHKIEHFGSVIIGDNVEIGCNTCIDRGSLGNTVIENGVRLDNLIQVAHNVTIGENTAIASLSGISGGTKIGKNCMIGGSTGFTGHINIADNTLINGMSMITKSITSPGHYASGTGFMDVNSWRKNVATFKKLYYFIKNIRAYIAKN